MTSDITPEAIGFLSAVGVFVVLLSVLFLFINKKLCFSRVGGLPCLEHLGPDRRSWGKGGAHRGLVNSYGEDDGPSTSSDSEEEVAKQFESSVSLSQSFHSGVTEKEPQAAPEGRHKFTQLLSDQEDSSTRPSKYEGPGPQGRQSCSRVHPGSRGPRDTVDGLELELELRKAPVGEEGIPGSSEMETAVDSLGFDNSGATWSPEDEFGEVPPQPPDACQPASVCRDLSLVLDYRPKSQKLLVTVVTVATAWVEECDGDEAWQVQVALLPGRRRRHRTVLQQGALPCFDETFRFSRLEHGELARSALRFRLYTAGRTSCERVVGERLLPLGGLKLEGMVEATLALEPHSSRKKADSHHSLSAMSQSESISSTQSLAHSGGPELLLGLAYNSTTGRLSVELIRGSHFRSLAVNRPPDTYGKLTLLDSTGQQISRCKSSVRRGQPNPVYKETFVFQVALFQLSDVTLLVSIYSRRSMKRKEVVGWVSLGQSSSGQEEQLHWQDMRESSGQQVCRWHSLQES